MRRRTENLDGEEPGRRDYLGAVVQAATLREPGEWTEVPLECASEHCGRRLWVLPPKSADEEVSWRCHGCVQEGAIAGWRGTQWDLSGVPRTRSAVSLVVTPAEYRALAALGLAGTAAGRIVAGGGIVGGGVLLGGSRAEMKDLRGRLDVPAGAANGPLLRAVRRKVKDAIAASGERSSSRAAGGRLIADALSRTRGEIEPFFSEALEATHPVKRAWREYWGGRPLGAPSAEDLVHFTPFLLYVWSPDGAPPAARLWLDRAPGDLDPFYRGFLEAQLRAPFSFHQVVAVEPGRGLRLRDLLLGIERFVLQPDVANGARPGFVMFARAVDLEGASFVDGHGVLSFGGASGEGPAIVARKQLGLGPEEPASRELLVERSTTLVGVYHGFWTAMVLRGDLGPLMEQLDPPVRVHLRYRLRVRDERRATSDEIERRLLDRPGITRWGRREQDHSMLLWERSPGAPWPWVQAGGALLRVYDRFLCVDTISRGRALHAEAMIQSACPELCEPDASDDPGAPPPVAPVFRPWPGIPTS